MPRQRQPARLWLRPAADDRAAVWVILDGGKQIRTGCDRFDRSGAEAELARYIGFSKNNKAEIAAKILNEVWAA